MTIYRLDVYDTNGVLQAQITDFEYLSYTRQVNAPGVLDLGIGGEHRLLDDLQDKWQFEVWRKPESAEWRREFVGIFRWFQWVYDKQPEVRILCNGIMSMLSWRIVAWKAGLADRSRFINKPAETIANTLVKYNATADATVTNGRIRDGAIMGLTVESDQAGGNNLDWFCAYANLLETLQDLVRVGGGDFDLVKTGSTAYEWRWYTGQMGIDRTADIIFALDRDNMANPVQLDNRLDERTAAIIGGQGEGEDRETVVRLGDDYGADNDFEIFVSASDVTTTAGLQARGDQKLNEKRALRDFAFNVVQIPACRYGVNYDLGDLVSVINPYTGAKSTAKVRSVIIGLQKNGEETVNVEVRSV